MKTAFLSAQLALILFLSSCGKDDKRLEEVSGIQGRAAAEKQIEEENRNLATKAQAMEGELKSRTEYYKAPIRKQVV